MTRVQRCKGLAGSASAGSSTAGNDPPAVRGPLDAENSVDTIRPVDGQRRTLPAVAPIAASGQFVLFRRRRARRRRDPPAGAFVDLAGRAVARLRVRVSSLRQRVRPGRDGLGPQRIGAGPAAGGSPARRTLARHHAAEVRLDEHGVDGAILAGSAIGRDDVTPVVVDDAALTADAEQICRRQCPDRRRPAS